MVTVLITGALFAESRPLADGIEAYSLNYPIDPHIPEMLKYINTVSMDYNAQGYGLYGKGLYKEAVTKFKQALKADAGNSFAMYNMACSYALMNEGYAVQAAEQLADAIRETGGAYWGVQLMTDPDLDSLRDFDTGGANHYIDPMGMGEYVLLPDGKALMLSALGGAHRPPVEGYFCVVDSYVFTSFDVPDWEYAGSETDYQLIPGALVADAVPLKEFSFKKLSEIGL